VTPFSASTQTVNVDVSNASQRVLVSKGRGPQQIRWKNDGSATVWIRFGDSTVTADTATAMPVGSGDCEVQTVLAPYNGDVYVAAIAAASTGKIYFTPGAGI